MSEEKFYNSEHPNLPEHAALPEHSSLPEYNPVYPDVTFFKESSVTTREENIFQGEPPAGEKRRISREEKRKERERFSLLQKILGSALRGGAAVLAAAVAVSAVSSAQDGDLAASVRKLIQGGKKPAFTQQTGYDAGALARLWARDPDAPHKYDTEHPVVYRAATCTQDGEEELICLECGVHSHSILTAGGHRDGEPVKENEVAATCQQEGGYTEVINCIVCGTELSRRNVVVAKKEHTPGESEIANEVEATCTEDGHRYETVICTVCGEVISSGEVIVPATGHNAAVAVVENGSEATCTESGHYDSVVYCSTCGEELSRTEVTEPAKGHQAAAPVKENEVAATCETEGSYDNVVYCSVCSEEMARTTIKVTALGHDWGPVTYTWASDNSTVTATKPCRNDSSHNITETVQAASEVVTEPDCETTGTTRYTATFSNSAFTSQTKTVTVAALGHDYETIYEWNYEDGICYAYAYCMRHPNDPSHNVEETSTATRTVTKAATCVDDGSYTLTASFSSSAFSTQTVEDEIPATGEHHYVDTREIESQSCTHIQYYHISKCDVCGQIEPDTIAVAEDPEPGPGHQWSLTPHGYTSCSVCGQSAIDAWLNGAYVVYSIDSNYMDAMTAAGNSYSTVQLVFVDTGTVINSGGYEGGYGSNIMIPDEYREPGGRLRVDFYFGNYYISSNTVTID